MALGPRLGRPQGPRPPGAHRPARHRAVLGERHRPALDRRPHLGPGGRRAGRESRLEQLPTSCRRRPPCRWTPAARAWSASRAGTRSWSAPATAARQPRHRGDPSRRRRLVAGHERRPAARRRPAVADPSGASSATPSPTTWVVGTPISNGGAVVRWAGSVFAAERPDSPKEFARPPVERSGGAGPCRQASSRAVKVSSCCRSSSPSAARSGTPTFVARSSGSASTTRGPTSSAPPSRASRSARDYPRRSRRASSPVTSIRATGGVFRSELWREVLAGVLGRPLTVTAGAGDPALGAAALGLHAVGVQPTLEEALEHLAPGLVECLPDHDATVVADGASAAAYRMARRSAARTASRPRMPAAALLAGPDTRRQPAPAHLAGRQQRATRCRPGPSGRLH